MYSASSARFAAAAALGAAALLAASHAHAAPDPAARGAAPPEALLRALQPAQAPPASGLVASELRVCADPNNLPFSNERGEGFENEISRLLAADLGRPLRYTWQPQRRGFIRQTLDAGECDLVIGAPADYRRVATTRPYYRSTYVFVTRRDRGPAIASFDDPRLRVLRVGVQVVGDDYANVPPAQALAWRRIVDNVRGFPVYGDYRKPDPPRDLIDAVAAGEIDVGIAWGPLAGYFAEREPVALDVVAVAPQLDRGMLPMSFEIALGVRRRDIGFRDRVQQALDRHRAEIDALLRRYGVPLVAPALASAAKE